MSSTNNREPRGNSGQRIARARRIPLIQVVSLFVAAVVVIVFIVSKVGADGAHGGRANAENVPAPPTSRAQPVPTPPEPKPSDVRADTAKDDATAPQLRTAKLAPGSEGGVPVHEGRFRSPFATPDQPQVQAKIGLLLASVDDYDIKKGEFTAQFFLTMTSDKPMSNIDMKATNGKIDAQEVLADLPTFKMWKMFGTFHNKPDLHAYPFDTQELVIELEDDSNGQDRLRLRTDVEHTNVDAHFAVPGWETSFVRGRVLTHYYPPRFENDDLYYSKYHFGLGIRRFATSAVFTVFVPALVIVLISLSGLWFPRDELEVRSNATTPMLAAAVLFHFALMQALPATAYLSRADKLMMAVYACLGLHMFSSWIWFVFEEHHTDRIFKLAKWICGPLTFVIMALGILL